MDSTEPVENLSELLRLGGAVTRAYDEAIGRLSSMPVHQAQVEQFRNEHRKQLIDLETAVLEAGRGDALEELIGAPTPEIKPGGEERDPEQILRMFQANDEIFRNSVRRALDQGNPGNAAILLRRILDDEDRHVRYLEQLIQARVWELEEPTTYDDAF